MPAGPDPFTFKDGERTIHFGRGRADAAVELVGGPGFALLSTDRALAAVPALAEAAAAVHRVGRGGVDALAGELLGAVVHERVVALGGGRVIDTGKSVVAARGGVLAAVPTTLSGAEMTATHRPAAGSGAAAAAPLRPAIVVFDPAIAASQPAPELAASSLN